VLRVGEEADEERRERHGEDGADERLFATEAVANPPEQRAADRPHQEARGEGAEGREGMPSNCRWEE
jgi:hypothetical protein